MHPKYSIFFGKYIYSEDEQFKLIQEDLISYAYDLNCNISLINALKWSKSIKDIKLIMKQGAGVGFKSFLERCNCLLKDASHGSQCNWWENP